MKPLPRVLILLLLLTLAAGPARQAFAAVGTPFDLQGYIDKAVQSGEKKIVVPPGRYRVTPRRGQHLVLRDLADVEIVADGVELICTETTRAVTISKCRNLTLRGLVIDYDPLPFTQGRIVRLSADKKIHEIELFEGYPDASLVDNFKYEIFRADTRTLRCRDHQIKSIEKPDARHLRLNCASGRADDPEQVGDIIVIGARYTPHGNAAHAVVCEDNTNVRLENITLYASNCFGFLETGCDGSTYDHCRVDRRPAEGDLVKRADPRIRSLDADAFHSKHALKGPAYTRCVARFMGDDAINICGDYHMITACRGAELRVLAKSAMNIAAGDPVELLAYDGARLPDARALKVESEGRMSDAERAFLMKQRMDERTRTNPNHRAYKITLDRAIELPIGSLIAAANRMGNGFKVQGCDFGFNRSRGILIKASGGQVIGNTLTANWGEAIKVSPEYWWLESGSSNNVEIRNNLIRDCRAMGIAVYANGGPGTIAPAGAHSHITIANNSVAGSPAPNIWVTSTSDLRVTGNSCAPAQAAEAVKRPARQFGAETLEPIMTVNCKSATLERNTIK